MTAITLTKHHGLGNDFLIAVAPAAQLSAGDVVAWCDRRRGVGADGLIMALPGDEPGTWAMTLWNADGSRAEISGNGLRCLGQALDRHLDRVLDSDIDSRLDDDPDRHLGPGREPGVRSFRISTDAGDRQLQLTSGAGDATEQVTVEMGKPLAGPEPFAGWGGLGLHVERQLGVDVGNPHLVALVDGLDRIDLATVGPVVEAAYPGGINVELITVIDRSVIELRVWERGARITEACGSGACAAVWAAHQWNLVDDRAEVVMPGGSVSVDLIDGQAVLTGPTTFVATVEIEVR